MKKIASIFLGIFLISFVWAQDATPALTCDSKVEEANLAVFQAYLKDLTTSMDSLTERCIGQVKQRWIFLVLYLMAGDTPLMNLQPMNAR